MKLKPLQEFVATHYCGGEFSGIESTQQLVKCGDGLFRFLMDEAYDAGDMAELASMLGTAIRQLQGLKGEMT